MKSSRTWILAALLGAAAVVGGVRDAAACGGCFSPLTDNTLVSGHRMILSISTSQTTLYDEITYSGSPSSFAWVLPIQGLATVGLSSDALFQALDQDTAVTIQAPSTNCPCNFGDGSGDGAGGGTAGGPVTVVAQQTVGPYETVQLMSTDPSALTNWLIQHGYNIPAEVQPIIAAYVSESFNFLALKLVPGQGVGAMRPVRVSTPGASTTLPLRMVAAGTGTITPITLWVLGEGRYDTVNLPSFQIDPSTLVWDWDTSSSNYSLLEQASFQATNNLGWLLQAGEPFSRFQLQDQLDQLVQFDPANSGYADAMGNGASQAETDDLTALFSDIPDSSLWVTRLRGELSRAALAADLQVGASSDQSQVNRFFSPTNTTGTAPTCLSCGGGGSPGVGGSPGSGGSLGSGAGNGSGGGSSKGSGAGGGAPAPSGGGCAVTHGEDVQVLSGVALLAALALGRRRRRG